MSARALWIAAAIALLPIVASVVATTAPAAPAPTTAAAQCVGSPTLYDVATRLWSCVNGLTANLSARGQIHGNNWTIPADGFAMIGAIEPLVLNYFAAFSSRWPRMLEGDVNKMPQYKWANISGNFALHCSAVVGPMSSCVISAAQPLCPAQFTNMKAFMDTWAGRYCDVARGVPKADVLARLQSDFNSSMNIINCTINSNGTNFRDDTRNIWNYIDSECINLDKWTSLITDPAILKAEFFDLVKVMRGPFLQMARCEARAYDRYCPGALDSNWAIVSYALPLVLSSLLGGNVTSSDMSWKLPPVDVSAAAKRAVTGWFNGWLLSPAGPKWTKCLTGANDTTELLLSNTYGTVTRVAFYYGDIKVQNVTVTFDDTSSGTRTPIGAYTLALFGDTKSSLLQNAAGYEVAQLSAGNRTITLSRSADGFDKLFDSLSNTKYRLYANDDDEAAVLVSAPKSLLDRSFGKLPLGCFAPVPGATLPAPKAACLNARNCARTRGCNAADCRRVNDYVASGWAKVTAASKF